MQIFPSLTIQNDARIGVKFWGKTNHLFMRVDKNDHHSLSTIKKKNKKKKKKKKKKKEKKGPVHPTRELPSPPVVSSLALSAAAQDVVSELLDARTGMTTDWPVRFTSQRDCATSASSAASAFIEGARLRAVRRLGEIFRGRCAVVSDAGTSLLFSMLRHRRASLH